MIVRTLSLLALLMVFLVNLAWPACARMNFGITAQPQSIDENLWSKPDNVTAEMALQSALLATRNDPAKQLLVLQALADLYHESNKIEDEKDTLLTWINVAMGIKEYPLVYVATQNLRLSHTYFTLGEHDNAEKSAKTALEMYRQSSGEISPNVALALNNLAWIEIKQKEYAAAEFHLTYSLSIIKKAVGTDSLFYGLIADNLANLYGRIGNYRKALPLYKASLKALRQQLAADDPATNEVLQRYTQAQGIVKEQQHEKREAAQNKRRLAGDKSTHE